MNRIIFELQLGKPNDPPRIKDAVEHFLKTNQCTTVKCAFAYVSLAGLNESLGTLFKQEAFRNISKQWIVGIHNGITEPAAIEELTKHYNSSVRIYSPTKNLTKAALFSGEKLHAKILHLVSADADLIIVGSTNLTRAAIGSRCTNYEAGALFRSNDQSMCIQYNDWFSNLWDESIKASASVIDDYSKVRIPFLLKNRVVLPRLDEAPPDEMGARKNLWIEAGAMSGGDRNQVEFGPTLASYFGGLIRDRRMLRLKWHNITRDDRPLSHKVTKWNTEIWRLSMITSKQGGPQYPKRVIHFTKHHDGQGQFFSIDVANYNSKKSRMWQSSANRKGTIAMTGSSKGAAREYGVY